MLTANLQERRGSIDWMSKEGPLMRHRARPAGPFNSDTHPLTPPFTPADSVDVNGH